MKYLKITKAHAKFLPDQVIPATDNLAERLITAGVAHEVPEPKKIPLPKSKEKTATPPPAPAQKAKPKRKPTRPKSKPIK